MPLDEPATAHRLPFRVRVLCGWWHGRGWPFGTTSVLKGLPLNELIYVLVPAVALAESILVFGQLITLEEIALNGNGRSALMYATDLARTRGCHLAVGVPA